MRKKITILLISIASLAIIAGLAILLPPFFGKTEKDTMVYIRHGMTKEAFSDSLSLKFGKSFSKKIMLLDQLHPMDLGKRAGAYKLQKGWSPFVAWRKLSTGAQTPVRFTFNNIRTLDDFAGRAAENFSMSRDDMLAALTDTALLNKYGFTKETIPAMLLPDTYEFYWTAKPEKVLDKLHENYQRFWDKNRMEKAQLLGLSPVDVSTLASIVEEETANPAEKSTVARLYLNRLEKGMKLQSDPTVKFAVGDTQLKRILHKHLETNSPYNTYKVTGLPPGPIRFPEKSTLNAVLNAPKHDYIYMCAKEDFSGTHNFTASYATHMANARKYQIELNKRGIK